MTVPGRIALLAAGLSLTLGLAACTGGDDTSKDEPSTGGTGGASSTVTPGGDAKAYPVPASASAQAVPSLGVRKGLGYTVTLNEVRRVSDRMGLVTATLVPDASTVGNTFTEPGYTLWKNPQTGKLDSNYDFSAVTVSVKGDPTVYQVARDDQQQCACTRGMVTVKSGVPIGAYAYVTLPQEASTVTVVVRGLAPFTDVEVAS